MLSSVAPRPTAIAARASLAPTPSLRAPKGDAVRCIVSLNIRSGGGTRAARLCRYLDQLDPDTLLLTEWRDNVSGRSFANWAEDRGMSHAGLTDGCTANGVFLASLDPFAIESATPSAQGPGCLMLARFRHGRSWPVISHSSTLRLRFSADAWSWPGGIEVPHSSSPAISTSATSFRTAAKEQENITAPIISTGSHRRVSYQISGGSLMGRAASGPGTPPKAMAFGSTTLLAMAHSLQRPPQSALTIIAPVKPD